MAIIIELITIVDAPRIYACHCKNFVASINIQRTVKHLPFISRSVSKHNLFYIESMHCCLQLSPLKMPTRSNVPLARESKTLCSLGFRSCFYILFPIYTTAQLSVISIFHSSDLILNSHPGNENRSRVQNSCSWSELGAPQTRGAQNHATGMDISRTP